MSLRDFLFELIPGSCVLCAAASHRSMDLCEGCERDLPWIGTACQRCGIPLAENTCCIACTSKPGPVARTLAPLVYRTPVDRLINRFKHGGNLLAGRVLAEAVAHSVLPGLPASPDILVPVPLHPHRQRTRGFNQAEVIARIFARYLDAQVDTRCCIRNTDSVPQQSLTRAERERNLKGAFRTTRECVGTNIAIVDDVVTTGTTTRELARSLQRAGAARIDVLAIARTPTPWAVC